MLSTRRCWSSATDRRRSSWPRWPAAAGCRACSSATSSSAATTPVALDPDAVAVLDAHGVLDILRPYLVADPPSISPLDVRGVVKHHCVADRRHRVRRWTSSTASPTGAVRRPCSPTAGALGPQRRRVHRRRPLAERSFSGDRRRRGGGARRDQRAGRAHGGEQVTPGAARRRPPGSDMIEGATTARIPAASTWPARGRRRRDR